MTALDFSGAPALRDRHTGRIQFLAYGRHWYRLGTTWATRPYHSDVALPVTVPATIAALETAERDWQARHPNGNAA